MIVKAQRPVRIRGNTVPAGWLFRVTPEEAEILNRKGALITIVTPDPPRIEPQPPKKISRTPAKPKAKSKRG